ncbi:GNAT family N-acetyltransferase [Sulfurovum sp.]|jgi:ribosomal-protein-alanine N-acetyltransferase|uniref:GNAT family N-acetyltransferase n=1 Tax=Sulfurovum sp. TaxID=1969726 RepID=UPI002A361921|nr:GNAT family N-acetyltransferase [Sulfurovum sp.]MDY0403711.1 GNAT family N-acetyltransferase [Sulfurovum sp.]
MHIDFAGYSDLEKLLEIEEQTFDADSYPLSRRNFLYHIKKKHILVVRVDNRVVGYLLFFTYKKSWRIYSIAVAEGFRRKGLGRSLINRLREDAGGKAGYLLLEVKTDNTQALHLYALLGFKPLKILKAYYPDGDGIKMVLEI